ncbi:DUF3343 domain-containing protein [Acetobacterium fimetarium]|uniref:DUF3343 domain-containing protein n=1 Tax=Acetobacterium fimetarium TaxID=52691 RepID=A0ABR6WW57_9FIRM|nr:DUF3343 domain-containing protein [Acetobacterium fimetarium]MBC3804658.1 DUF3343 domain-containing protein [Acetobacterium fimetarium]
MIYYVITFANTHSAISTQSHLETCAKITIMPTLREISAGCGISIRFAPEELDHVLAGLKTWNLAAEMYQLYEITEKDGKIFPSQLSDKALT